MLPNEKKDLSQLKEDFADSGDNRITAKVIRDLIVSSYGSRWVSRLTDSTTLTENQDVVIVKMIEEDNYIKLPISHSDDSTGTPIEYKRYTIVNESASYNFNLITDPTDKFASPTSTPIQSIQIETGAVAEVVCYDSVWHIHIVGAVPSDIIGENQSTLLRKNDTIGNLVQDVVFDSATSEFSAVKWVVKISTDSGLVKTSEILFTKSQSGGEFVEYALVGDDFDVIVDVDWAGGTNDSIDLVVSNNLDEEISVTSVRFNI